MNKVMHSMLKKFNFRKDRNGCKALPCYITKASEFAQ